MEKLSNQERREQGLPYRFDGECAMAQVRAKELLQKLNSTIATDFPTIIPLVAELLGKSEGAYIHPPFHCNYGHNIETGKGLLSLRCVDTNVMLMSTLNTAKKNSFV